MAASVLILLLGSMIPWALVFLHQRATIREMLEHNRELARNLWAQRVAETGPGPAAQAAHLTQASEAATVNGHGIEVIEPLRRTLEEEDWAEFNRDG